MTPHGESKELSQPQPIGCKTKKKIFGVIGPIGAGKSSICKIFQEKGAYLIEADKVAHYVLTLPEIKKVLVHIFGPEILGLDGVLNRKRMAEKIFTDANRKKRFEAEVVPRVSKEIKALVEDICEGIIVIEGFTFIGTQIDKLIEFHILVSCSRKEMTRRIIERNGFTEDMANRRIEAMPAIYSDSPIWAEIYNNGSQEELKHKVELLWQKMQQAEASMKF